MGYALQHVPQCLWHTISLPSGIKKIPDIEKECLTTELFDISAVSLFNVIVAFILHLIILRVAFPHYHNISLQTNERKFPLLFPLQTVDRNNIKALILSFAEKDLRAFWKVREKTVSL
mmetsp:Transcript_52945/g.63753  ORF Transcript_52945/g.63753 Transcript_52945/m.63753 type:complete len:118 (+) Transcript_52945:792-1145(+)